MMVPVKKSTPHTDVTLNEQDSPEMSHTCADCTALQQTIQTLTEQVTMSQERERRALADYQNLMRRHQEDRAKFLSMANREVMIALVQPLEHLVKAAQQLNDKGVSMIVTEFKGALAQFGLEEIPVLGRRYDVSTMEVVERRGDGETVIAVAQAGYKLHGAVIVHAKVVIGTVEDQEKQAQPLVN